MSKPALNSPPPSSTIVIISEAWCNESKIPCPLFNWSAREFPFESTPSSTPSPLISLPTTICSTS